MESQEDILRRWVAERPDVIGRVYDHVYWDIESGTRDDRIGLRRLIADAKARKFDVAVAYNSDRWCRSLEIHVQMQRITRECGVRFITPHDFGDSPQGKLLANHLAGFNEFLSMTISEKVCAKRLARVERGEWNGGPAPYGYQCTAGKLLVVAEEARVVRQIFALWLEHPSPAQVRNRLEALGLRDREGRVWSTSNLRYVVQNATYIGEVRHHDTVRPGIHEAIIDRPTWEAAQRLIPTRTRLEESSYKRAYPLRGLLRCGHCGVGMKAHRAHGLGGRIYPRYRCDRTFKRDWAGCPVKEVRAEQIEGWLEKQLEALRLRPGLLDDVLSRINETAGERAKPLHEKARTLKSRIEGLRARSTTSSGRSPPAARGSSPCAQRWSWPSGTRRGCLRSTRRSGRRSSATRANRSAHSEYGKRWRISACPMTGRRTRSGASFSDSSSRRS